MQITEALKSLENSWSRDIVLLKIKNGENSEKIVNDFFNTKKKEIEILSNSFTQKDRILLSEIEKLSYIESKLIKKIKHFNPNKSLLSVVEKDPTSTLHYEENKSFNLGFFMMKWSNKFVFISLLVISAIALTKQAWA